jgi:pSer/pThr/pTyr-binding forkhead associated (FHA) protein
MFVITGLRGVTVPSHFRGNLLMQTRRDTATTSPSMIPIAGNFDRKPRSLERDVTTIGRARGSDLCLEANEISTLHCIIYRAPDGYRIRDCNSRCGTRVNGESVKSGKLQDCDIINLGPFSFEFRLPAAIFPQDSIKVDPGKIDHWKNSRRKFAQLALKLRKRVRQAPTGRDSDTSQNSHVLKERIRVYDQRLRELEEAEQELTGERDELAKTREEHQKRVQKVEGEIAERLAKADEEIKERWQKFQQRCQVEETQAREVAAAARRAEPESAVPVASLAPAVDNELEELRCHVQEFEKQLSRQQDQLQREQEEFTNMKDQWVRSQAKSAEALQEQQAVLAQQENAVRAHKAELGRMMAELKKLQEDLRKQAKGDLRGLQEELAKVQAENAELRTFLEAGVAGSPDVDELRAQVKLLQDELEAKELALLELREVPPAKSSHDSVNLRAENDLLKKLLEEKNQILEDMSAVHEQTPKSEGDLERYEAELNEFRRNLESDRNKLNAEVELLRERNKELDEAVREMEMEMSKERADLARERMRLERVREEVKTDMDKLQREASVRDSMAGVQKLRDEMTGKQPGKGEKSVTDRLRARTQVGDSTTAAS